MNLPQNTTAEELKQYFAMICDEVNVENIETNWKTKDGKVIYYNRATDTFQVNKTIA